MADLPNNALLSRTTSSTGLLTGMCFHAQLGWFNGTGRADSFVHSPYCNKQEYCTGGCMETLAPPIWTGPV